MADDVDREFNQSELVDAPVRLIQSTVVLVEHFIQELTAIESHSCSSAVHAVSALAAWY